MYNYFPKIYDKFMEYADYSLWKELIISACDKYSIKKENYLDLGCGTGKLLFQMKDEFSYCAGLDISENMLNVAKEKLKNYNIELFYDDMITFDLGKKYNVISAFFDTVNHILSVSELTVHFKHIFNELDDKGIYIFDLVDREFMNNMFENNIFIDERDNFTCIWTLEQDEGIDYIKAIYFVMNKNGLYEKNCEVYTKKIFTEEEIRSAIDKSGLKIVEKTVNDKIAGKRNIYILAKK